MKNRKAIGGNNQSQATPKTCNRVGNNSSIHTSTKTQIKLDNTHLLCSGTEPMNDRTDHVREVRFSLPKFKTLPTVSATIYSSDSPGNVMVIWSIEKDINGIETVITISATTPDGVGNPFTYFCDYVVIGEV